MKRIFALPVLVTILALAWHPVVQAQQSDAPKVEGIAAADLEQLRTLSAEGDPNAQYQLAEVYRIGFPVERDTAKAIELYKRSAGQGYAASQFRLGDLYEEGEILERDLGKAIESYRNAAEQGHSGAQYALAHIYHLGSGVTQDMAAALVWYRKAALQGDEWSQLALGDQYRIGLAVPRDLAQSTKWYRRAAERGNIFAQFELGNAYRFGNGVERDVSTQATSLVPPVGRGRQSLCEIRAHGTGDRRRRRGHGERAGAGGFAGRRLGRAHGDLGSRTRVIQNRRGRERGGSREPAAVQSGGAPKAASSAPLSDTAALGAPVAELAYAAEPSYSDEEEVSLLLAHAQGQVANLALTTPEGDNAYETYRLILSLQPNNESALAGIGQIGGEYASLAEQAAAKGNFLRARHYAAKAADLAPEHPLVQSMTIPMGADQPTSEETILTSETSEGIETPQRALVEPREATTKNEVAIAASAGVSPKNLVRDVDDLIFKPHNYRGREVVVTGSVIHLLWDYRLKAETGQNSLVIDVDRLSPANRAMLDAAIERAGFLGQVRARVKGRVKRQTPATFELAATELTLIGIAPTEDEALSPNLDPDFGEVAPPVVPVDPVEPLVRTNGSGNRTPSGDDDRASAAAINSYGGGLGGTSGGGNSSAGSGSSGDSGGPGGGNSGGRNHSAPIAAPVHYQPVLGHVPTCYQDAVWRRLPDGRIQTGTRTRCY